MSFVDALVIMGEVFAVLILLAAVAVPIATLIWYFKFKKIKKKVPELITKEVENERLKKELARELAARRYAGTGNPELERTLESIRTERADIKPEIVQSMDDVGDTQVERRPEPSPRRFRRID